MASLPEPIYSQEEVHVTFVRDRRGPCSWILNLLWLVLGGWHMFLSWFTVGILLCCSIIGIPCGVQVLKIACFLLFPFGKSITYNRPSYGNRCCSCACFLNVIWIVTVGWLLALQALGTGLVLCLSIVGIPFGWQCLKLAYISFWPFGLDVSAEMLETVTVTTTDYSKMQNA